MQDTEKASRPHLLRVVSIVPAGDVVSRGVPSRLDAPSSLLNAVHEEDPGSHEREEVCAIEASPPGLCHVEQLVGHQETLRA